MKKEKIRRLIDKAIFGLKSISCTMKHDDVYFNLVPLCRDGDFVLAAIDRDFQIDGYVIFSIGDVRSAETKGMMYDSIMRSEKVLDSHTAPPVDMRSFVSIFGTFLENTIPVSMDTKYGFYIGNVIKVGSKKVKISHFDPECRLSGMVKLPYDDIYMIYFGNRYTEIYSKYANVHDDAKSEK